MVVGGEVEEIRLVNPDSKISVSEIVCVVVEIGESGGESEEKAPRGSASSCGPLEVSECSIVSSSCCLFKELFNLNIGFSIRECHFIGDNVLREGSCKARRSELLLHVFLDSGFSVNGNSLIDSVIDRVKVSWGGSVETIVSEDKFQATSWGPVVDVSIFKERILTSSSVFQVESEFLGLFVPGNVEEVPSSVEIIIFDGEVSSSAGVSARNVIGSVVNTWVSVVGAEPDG